MLFAQVQPLSSSGLQVIIAGLVLLLGISVGAAQLYSVFRRKPPIEAEFVAKTECGGLRDAIYARIHKLEQESETTVSADDFREMRRELTVAVADIRSKIETDFRELFARLDEVRTDLNAQNERRASGLHDRINVLGERVSRVEGKVKA